MYQFLLMSAMLTPGAWGPGNCGPVGSRVQVQHAAPQQFVQREEWMYHAQWKQCFLYRGSQLLAGYNPKNDEFRWYAHEQGDWGPAVKPPERLVASITKMKQELLVTFTTLLVEEQAPPPGITPIDGPANRLAPPKGPAAVPSAPGGHQQAAGCGSCNEGGCRKIHRGGRRHQSGSRGCGGRRGCH